MMHGMNVIDTFWIQCFIDILNLLDKLKNNKRNVLILKHKQDSSVYIK